MIRMTKLRKMTWVGHIAPKREERNYWWESQKERHHLEYQDIGGWIILSWILQIGWGDMEWIGLA
jgi:hypothetical protein